MLGAWSRSPDALYSRPRLPFFAVAIQICCRLHASRATHHATGAESTSCSNQLWTSIDLPLVAADSPMRSKPVDIDSYRQLADVRSSVFWCFRYFYSAL